MKSYRYKHKVDPVTGVIKYDVLDDGNIILHCVDGEERISSIPHILLDVLEYDVTNYEETP